MVCSCCSVTRTRTGPPFSSLLKDWIPKALWRRPHSGSSAISTCPLGCWWSHPSRGSRCRPLYGPGCGLHRNRREIAPVATRRWTARPQRPSRPAETRHLTAAIDRDRQFIDPAGEYALDMVPPQSVIVSRGKVTGIQTDPGEPSDLHYLSLREEPISDSALIEDQASRVWSISN